MTRKGTFFLNSGGVGQGSESDPGHISKLEAGAEQ